MHKDLKKNVIFSLIALLAFGYQFSVLPFSNVEYNTVRAANQCTVILGGQPIGVSISNGGVAVVGVSDFRGEDGKSYSPAAEGGIKKDDIIISVNDENINSSKDISAIVSRNANQMISITYMRDGKEKSTVINAVKSAADGKYHLGMWVNDGINGLGTLTFINPQNGTFGALGHGVKDGVNGEIVQGEGNIYFANISDVNKSTKNKIGEVKGYFSSSEIGYFSKNTELGIFGTLKTDLNKLNGEAVEIMTKEEIKKGEAYILCCIDGKKSEKFRVDIEKINVNSRDNKNMVIKITDQSLLNRTGGIVQGMSGSPIIQNGKLIGAVTHVFVNDPTRGYGIFIENMLEEAEKIK